ncbi:bifunctional diguanylate cyclase/phosphodiesterase [Massilia sp. IC2-476]|uniref:putative bifunctional diguanylate cyclase/phosphodiesterase n=1 Tax=Massilia sp. IC2-476 TaxID=2887199 RepID=UPI001D126125|nr:EAL domain-containing protein [Massilia sp. IC2-476]MCC2973462.1 EAL domain-containing protein [Massilia sp. IC2-476]
MNAPYDLPHHETVRLEALRQLNLLDTAPSEAFDRITRMAAQLFQLPIAAVSLTDTDRQWFKSKVGVEHNAIPRMKAPCAAVADSGRMLEVPDLLESECFRDSPLAAGGIRFYLGAPLVTKAGHCLGAMCVLGTEPRAVTEAERTTLADLAAMVMAQIELQHALGRIDPVSGLPNRNQFVSDVRDLSLAAAEGEPQLAALVSLATPEELSDAMRVMGSTWLDEIVSGAVPALRRLVGGGKVYHVGPTQFAFLAPLGMSLVRFSSLLMAWVAERTPMGQTGFLTTSTVGLVRFAVGQDAPLDVLRNLHSAAHDARDAESGLRVYSPEQDAAYRHRFWLISELGRALAQPDELHLVFQPKVSLRDGRCLGAEALLRWTHPEAGPIGPGEFMPIAETTSLARATTEWVLEAAMRQLAAWRNEGVALQVAVNVSAVNLEEPDFSDRVLDGLARHGLDPASLALEMTESALMRKPKAAHDTMARLAEGGVKIAIDDFGTGYSSLAYLQDMPADVVKIDQSFVRGMGKDERTRALVTTMIKLSHDLGHRVVAEGVETAEVAALLREAGCDEAQGYFYGRPMAPTALAAWLAAR